MTPVKMGIGPSLRIVGMQREEGNEEIETGLEGLSRSSQMGDMYLRFFVIRIRRSKTAGVPLKPASRLVASG